MKTGFFLLSLLIVTLSVMPPAAAAPESIEVLYVPANGNQVSTAASLIQGQTYTFRISGMFVWGGCGPVVCPGGAPDYTRWADARFMTDDHFHNVHTGYVYLTINGSIPHIPQYSPDHIYTVQVVGTGAPATFRIQDGGCCYADNSGALRVELLSPGEPPAIAMGVKPFSQYSVPVVITAGWGEDRYGDPRTTDESDIICRWGCNLTAWAMMLDYYGAAYGKHSNPRELNNWLREHEGYIVRGVVYNKVVQYANEYWGETPLRLSPVRVEGRNDQRLHQLLSAGIPVMLRVNNGNHFVLAVGETMQSGVQTWYIHDPGGCNADPYTSPLTTLLSRYQNQYTHMYWAEAQAAPTPRSSITLALGSPAELLITDPLGRRTGIDVRTGEIHSEILDSSYLLEQLASDDETGGLDDHPIKMFNLPLPMDGSYTVEIIGRDNGAYTLDVFAYDEIGGLTRATLPGSITPGEVDTITIIYSADPDEGIHIRYAHPIFLPFIRKP